MKISQISEYSLPAEGGLPPLQAMIYEEIMRRPDEVFEYQGEELLRSRIADLLIAPELAGIDMRDWRAYDAAVEQGYAEAVAALKELGGGPERLRRRRASLS